MKVASGFLLSLVRAAGRQARTLTKDQKRKRTPAR